jgi:DNA-directed RNA polymerase specialized sigma24 family protein
MDSVETPNAAQDLKQVLGRVLLAAHLITGSLEHAEQAVLKAVEQWIPHEESEDKFLSIVIHEAAGMDASPEPREPIMPGHCLSEELKAVLRLEPLLRSCFVLRNLVGLPSRDCARLLRLLPGEIDEYNVCALRRLALS